MTQNKLTTKSSMGKQNDEHERKTQALGPYRY